MQEELLQFKIQNVWTLVDCPKEVRPIGTKWVLKNKKDERGIVIKNKARLVAQGHTQEEGIDYDEPLGFQDPKFLAKVYKVEKAMYGLHQASRAWYGTLSKYLLKNGFQRLCREFEALMHDKFQMSVMDVRSSNTPMDKENPWGKDETGTDVDLYLYRSMIVSLMYLTASRPDIMFAVCDCARHQVTPKECHLYAVKRIFRYLKGHPKLGLWYPKESPFDLVSFSDNDYDGATQDHKSTTRGCQFLGRRLISWQCKKQTIVATSTTEAEYVAVASCCGQVLWIQNQLLDYGHHFIRDCFEKKLISVDHIHTDENIADLLTKPFDARSLKLIPLVSKGFAMVKAGCKTCWSSQHLRHCEKGEHNTDFHPMVDFIEASPLRYALTVKPTVYVSHLRKFWSTARIETTAEGTKILATVDGIVRTVSKSSLSPSFSGRTVPLFAAMLVHQDEPASPQRDVSQEEAYPTNSGFIADQDRATIDKSSTLPHDSVPRVTSPAAVEGTQEVEISRLKERVKQLKEREGVAATNSGDDAPIKGRSIDEEEAATERVSDDTKEMATVLTSMDAAIVLASGVVDVPTGSGSIPTASTPAEGSIPTGREEVPTASPVFSTATVVTPVIRRKGKEVMVKSKTPKKQKVQEQIDAQVARELKEQLEKEDQRRADQIARDAVIARIYAKEELQSMIDGLNSNNETVAKYLEEYHQFSLELPMERKIELISDAKIYKFQSQKRKPWTKKQKRDYYMVVIKNNLGWKVKDFRGMTFEKVEAKFNSIWKQMEDFIPKVSKEEAGRIKRKGINLEQESAKKQKSSKEITEEAKSPEEVTEEKVKEMMHLVPIEEMYVEALQVKHPIINWKTQNLMHAPVKWKLYDSCRVHHVAAKDKEIFMLVEKDYPLRKGLELVMICYKLQVENFSHMENELVLKIYRIANSPRQQEEVPTASVEGCHCQKKSEATTRKIALLSKVKKKLSVKVK
nr:hypothetical protein [Tanacetum cinerariifolium]